MRSMIVLAMVVGTGCATHEQGGTVVGGAAGGAVGYAIGGVPGLIIGGIAGGATGNVIGRKMDDEDRRRAAYALERNQQMEWENRQGERYQVVPTQTTYQQGRECRNFQMTSYVDGRPDEINGVACRRPDGRWEMANNQG